MADTAGLAKELAAAKENELAEWRSKVVVDSDYFAPHITQKRTNQIDRYMGLLKGKASGTL